MYQDSIECFAIDVLHCSLDDLKLLEQVYSPLAELCNNGKIIDHLDNLSKMLEITYKSISVKIASLLDSVVSEGEVELSNEDGTGWVIYRIEGKLKEDFEKVINELKNSTPDCTDLKNPMFNNYLDLKDLKYLLDFEETPETNRDYTIQCLFDNNILNGKGYEK